jgi:sortase A
MERRAAGIAALQRRAVAGRAVGSIRIPGAGLDAIVVQGAGQGALNRGPGHYAGTAWPGQGGTVGIAGHRTTHGAPFAEIGDLRRGDRIVLRMPYGTFRYRVTGHRVVDPSQGEVLRDVGRERLVLTTCHPRWSATQRLVVEAEPVPGPPVA